MPSGTEWLWIAGCAAVLVLVKLASRTPVWPRVVKFLGGPDPDYPKPALEDGEATVREGRAEFTRSLHGGTGGPIILTNRRIIWYEDRSRVPWPFKRISGELDLSDIASADQGIILAHVFGGRRLWVRLRNGKAKALWVDGVDEWIKAIRRATGGTAGLSE